METQEEPPESLPIPSKNAIVDQLCKQIEFYFSDSNLLKDRWLKEKIEENPEGYIPVQSLLMFNKLMKISTDKHLIEDAIAQSKLLQLNDDKTLVKRRVPLAQISQSEITARTVYVENIPSDSTHDSLKVVFTKSGEVSYVSIPRFEDKKVKGFAFIEFTSPSSALRAVRELNQFDASTAPTGLRVISKKQWLEMRSQYKQLLAEQEGQQVTEIPGRRPKHSTPERHPVGVIAKITNINDNISKAQLREAVEFKFPVVYLDFKKKSIVAHVRTTLPSEALELVAAKDQLGEKLGKDITVDVITGDEEDEYWKRVFENKHEKKQYDKRRKDDNSSRVQHKKKKMYQDHKKEFKSGSKSGSSESQAKHMKFSESDDEANNNNNNNSDPMMESPLKQGSAPENKCQSEMEKDKEYYDLMLKDLEKREHHHHHPGEKVVVTIEPDQVKPEMTEVTTDDCPPTSNPMVEHL